MVSADLREMANHNGNGQTGLELIPGANNNADQGTNRLDGISGPNNDRPASIRVANYGQSFDDANLTVAGQEHPAGTNGQTASGQGEIPPVSQSHGFGNVPAGQADGRPTPIHTSPKHAVTRTLKKGSLKGKDVFVLHNYAELQKLAWAVAEGHFKLVILLGNPGVGKTRAFQAALDENALKLHGRVTTIHFYMEGYWHRGRVVMLDDVNGLLDTPTGIDLLKEFTQTETERKVCWRTATRLLDEMKVPREYTTSSPVIIIANNLPKLEQKLPALESRGKLVLFDPPRLEMHANASEWFTDQEIFDYIGDNLHFIKGYDLRTYEDAGDWKAAGWDWRARLVKHDKAQILRLVAQLRADLTFRTEEDRAKKFTELGGGSRSTYFRYAEKLEGLPPVPRIRLPNADGLIGE